MPVVFTYVQSVKRQMSHEMATCNVNARQIFDDVAALRAVFPFAQTGNRTARQAGYDVHPSKPTPVGYSGGDAAAAEVKGNSPAAAYEDKPFVAVGVEGEV